MDDLATVEIFECQTNLINDILFMDVLQNVLSASDHSVPDDIVQICLHKFKHQVYVLVIFGSKDAVQTNDIFMTELF